jgi:hypothetical protein
MEEGFTLHDSGYSLFGMLYLLVRVARRGRGGDEWGGEMPGEHPVLAALGGGRVSYLGRRVIMF